MCENTVRDNTKFYLYIDNYITLSYGIRCLYDFAATLSDEGYETRIVCNGIGGTRDEVPKRYRELLVDNCGKTIEINENDIAIYGDTISGNPLGAKRVIRWLLNAPGVLTGHSVNYGYEDLVYAYSTHISQDLPQLFYMLDERKYYNKIRKNAQRRKDTVTLYYGKCFDSTLRDNSVAIKYITDKFNHVQVITRCHPENREKTLQMVANSSLVVSFDPLTAIRFESQLLGVPILMLGDQYNIKDVVFNIESNAEYYSIADWENAGKYDIDYTWNNYCRYIERQGSTIKEWALSVCNRFCQLESNPKDMVANAEENRKRSIADNKICKESELANKWVNVLEYEDIPLRTLLQIKNKLENRKFIMKRKTLRIVKDRLKYGV